MKDLNPVFGELTMSDYTQGPWEVIFNLIEKPGYEGYIKRSKIVSREELPCGGSVRWTIAEMGWVNPNKADAYLISASPDMYDALEQVFAESATPTFEDDRLDYIEVHISKRTIRQVEQALNKAKGVKE